MADMLSTGVSGLLAFQRALDATSHNIANASTPGYSRQVVTLATEGADPLGSGWVGRGVQVTSIRRVYDEALTAQARAASSGFAQLDTFATLAGRIDNLFSDATSGLATTLQQFANALQGVASTPTSSAARQVLLSQASALVSRLQGYDASLATIGGQADAQLRSEASSVSALAASIADVNRQVVAAVGRNQQPPNDLLDQRDQLVAELARHVSVSTVAQDDGSLNVFIGTGQALVTAGNAARLTTVADVFDPTRPQLALQVGGTSVDVTDAIGGGTLGGLLQFRTTMLDAARNTLGQVAVTVVTLVNAQHAAGLDLDGQFGGALLEVGDVRTLPAGDNGGSATVSVTRADPGGLTSGDYTLQYDGSAWSLTRTDTGAAVSLSGSGSAADPLLAEGLQIVVSAGAVAGDRFRIQPTHQAIGGMSVQISDPARIAAAAPLAVAAAAANTGSGAPASAAVTDPSGWVRGTYTLLFDAVGGWSITDAGGGTVASGASYTAGTPIDFNGMRVTLGGTPAAGDRFTVNATGNVPGDNRNALQLAGILARPVLNGGSASVQDVVSQLITSVGVQTHQAQVGRDAQQAVLEDASSALAGASGVNLDEEAAALVRYQQAYQAAARIISVADTLFQALLNATGR
ncbi:MAG: flagellar hook-associated protein FlgK [Gammaproteobacteria bacterium]|nr:flagellar hook-associated protein FlgK [Gammaproteobacteria bacterium]